MSSVEKKGKGLTRRDFVKGAAAGAVGGLIAGTAGTAMAAAKRRRKPWSPPRWNKETDVVVLGYGGAGAVTAITARDKGAKVIILEKQAEGKQTSSTIMAGGSFWIFNNKADGVTYLKAMAMGLTPDDVQEAFAEKAMLCVDWIKGIGGNVKNFKAKPGFPELPGAGSFDGYYSIPKGTPGTTGRTGGENLFNLLAENVKSRGIEVVYNAPARKLVQTPEGEIVGVIAKRDGKDMAIKARKAVVLACGGFGHNERMKMDYLKPYPIEVYGNPDNTGDGIKMAQKVGAALWHMSSFGGRLACRFPDTPTGQLVNIGPAPYIIVDQKGKRYANEYLQQQIDHAYLYFIMDFDIHHVKYTRSPSWWIFDETRRKAGPLYYPSFGAVHIGLIPWSKDNLAEIEKGWIIKADTITELAGKIGLDPGTLEGTVKTYNRYCDTGVDPDFGRPKTSLVSLAKPPYYAVKMVVSSWATQGGPTRNAKCQILDPDGKPIPRLYSAGELGSFFGQTYQGGGMLTEVIVSGLIAGENTAAEKPWLG